MTVRNKLAHDFGLLLDDRYCPGILAARHAALDDPHVKPLNELARQIATTETLRAAASV